MGQKVNDVLFDDDKAPRRTRQSKCAELIDSVKKTGKTRRVVGMFALGLAVAVTIVVLLSFLRPVPVDESYFESNEEKTVISLNASGKDGRTGFTYLVYTNDGESITGLKTYYEYPDEAAAQAAIGTLREQSEFEKAVVSGKYIVVTADSKQYEKLTLSDVRQQAEAIKQFQEQEHSNGG